MRKILSYIKSHIYDIHSIMVGVVLVAIIYFIKQPLRRKIEDIVDRKMANQSESQEKRKSILRRWNIFLLAFLMVMAIGGFALLALISPFVDFSLQSGVMSGVYALCGNAFIEQITQKSKSRNS